MNPAFGTRVTRDGRLPRSARATPRRCCRRQHVIVAACGSRYARPSTTRAVHHGVVTAAHEIDERLARMAVDRGHARARARGLLTVAEAVDHATSVPLPTRLLRQRSPDSASPGNGTSRTRFRSSNGGRHFFIVIVVPVPTNGHDLELVHQALAPGRPAPTPCEVEYRTASRARCPECRALIDRDHGHTLAIAVLFEAEDDLALLAYIRMLRAISEMAAAMTVCSPLENPATAANARPCCLASTTSTSAAIGRRSSSPTAAWFLGFGFERGAFFGAAVEEGETLFEVQHGGDAFQRQTELHMAKATSG